MMTDVQTTHPLFQVLLLLLLCAPTHVRDTRGCSRSEQAANQSDDALIEPWAEVNAEQFRNPALSFCVSIINPWLALIARARSIRTQLCIWRRRLHRFLSLTLSHYLSLSLLFLCLLKAAFPCQTNQIFDDKVSGCLLRVSLPAFD